MKVLILHSELGMLRGGGENFVKNLFTEFAHRGHEVHSAFAADSIGRYPVPLPPLLNPLPVRGLWFRQFGETWLSTAGRMISRGNVAPPIWVRVQDSASWRNFRRYNRRFTARIEKLLADRWTEYDMVFTNGLDLALLAAARRPTMLWLAGPLGAEIEPQLRQVPVVSADGDAFLRMREFLGDHITELSIGLDGSRFRPGTDSERAALGWGPQHCVFGYVGRLTQLKGADILAAAFSEISRDYPQARLLVLGSGESERSVRSTLKAEIAGGLVHIHPGVDHQQLPLWYRAMNVLVLPSRYENFSNSLLEAAACGLPFIASDVGGNRILRKSGGAGDLFAVGSVSELVRCMQDFLASPEPKSAAALGFSSIVREKYTWAASADRLEWILKTRLGLAASLDRPRGDSETKRLVSSAADGQKIP